MIFLLECWISLPNTPVFLQQCIFYWVWEKSLITRCHIPRNLLCIQAVLYTSGAAVTWGKHEHIFGCCRNLGRVLNNNNDKKKSSNIRGIHSLLDIWKLFIIKPTNQHCNPNQAVVYNMISLILHVICDISSLNP